MDGLLIPLLGIGFWVLAFLIWSYNNRTDKENEAQHKAMMENRQKIRDEEEKARCAALTQFNEIVRKAIESQEQLYLKYSKQDGAISERIIVPIELYQKGRNSYLRGMCFRTHEERTFRIDRIINLAHVNSIT